MQAYASEFRIVADTELITNRLYAALNLIYEPEVAKPADTGMWERSSSAGVGAGLAYRITPTFAMGVAAEYDRAYDGLTSANFRRPCALCRADTCRSISAARCCWPRRLWRRSPVMRSTIRGRLDLTNFERYRANLKFEV